MNRTTPGATPAWTPKAPWRNKFVREFRLERWSIVVLFRWYRGLGAAAFEFEFRLGKPSKIQLADWIDYEGGPDE